MQWEQHETEVRVRWEGKPWEKGDKGKKVVGRAVEHEERRVGELWTEIETGCNKVEEHSFAHEGLQGDNRPVQALQAGEGWETVIIYQLWKIIGEAILFKLLINMSSFYVELCNMFIRPARQIYNKHDLGRKWKYAGNPSLGELGRRIDF